MSGRISGLTDSQLIRCNASEPAVSSLLDTLWSKASPPEMWTYRRSVFRTGTLAAAAVPLMIARVSGIATENLLCIRVGPYHLVPLRMPPHPLAKC